MMNNKYLDESQVLDISKIKSILTNSDIIQTDFDVGKKSECYDQINDKIILDNVDIICSSEVPSDIEIPVRSPNGPTRRALCAEFPENKTILPKLEALFNSPDVPECSFDLFKDDDYSVIDNIEDLKKIMSQVLIRFDTDPKHYTKSDYKYLLALLYKSLIYIYEHNKIQIGPNLNEILTILANDVIDLKYKAVTYGDTVENPDQTIPTVSYMDNYKLQWREF